MPMNAIQQILLAGIASCAFAAADVPKPDNAHDQSLAKMREKGTYESNLVGHLLKPFDSQLLIQLASNPEADTEEKLATLILRAGAEKNARFQYLLEQKELRKRPGIDLALFAFDYSVNGNQKALESILSRHVNGAGQRSWDSETVMVLAYVNEWNLTKKALGSHVLSADGAGGDARYAFWLTRRYFFPANNQFPDDYQGFIKEISINP